ncbi:MAG: SsrA-binding protein SmpB [Bacteroidales bacterium]|nr:SsrA-binding protein SmpB [Bacteroidales bacterium]
MSNIINIKNKKASHEYFLLEYFSAGIVLTGTEIKSIRMGKASLVDSYCVLYKNELYVKNMHIAEYSLASYNKHEAKRDRKLLLTKREIKKITNKINEKGLTIVPVRLYINEKGLAKLDIAIAKGKKLYDKRESLKMKDIKREIERSSD